MPDFPQIIKSHPTRTDSDGIPYQVGPIAGGGSANITVKVTDETGNVRTDGSVAVYLNNEIRTNGGTDIKIPTLSIFLQIPVAEGIPVLFWPYEESKEYDFNFKYRDSKGVIFPVYPKVNKEIKWTLNLKKDDNKGGILKTRPPVELTMKSPRPTYNCDKTRGTVKADQNSGSCKDDEATCKSKCKMHFGCNTDKKCTAVEYRVSNRDSEAKCQSKCRKYTCKSKGCYKEDYGSDVDNFYNSNDACNKNCNQNYTCSNEPDYNCVPGLFTTGEYFSQSKCKTGCKAPEAPDAPPPPPPPPKTYSCINNECIEQFDGTGEFLTPNCDDKCKKTYSCINYECIEQFDGSGEFLTPNCDDKCKKPVVKKNNNKLLFFQLLCIMLGIAILIFIVMIFAVKPNPSTQVFTEIHTPTPQPQPNIFNRMISPIPQPNIIFSPNQNQSLIELVAPPVEEPFSLFF